jgi:hypothetical protein
MSEPKHTGLPINGAGAHLNLARPLLLRISFDPLVDFLTMHGHVFRSKNAEPDLKAFDPDYLEGDLLTDHYGFAYAAGEYEHVVNPPWHVPQIVPPAYAASPSFILSSNCKGVLRKTLANFFRKSSMSSQSFITATTRWIWSLTR